MAPLDQRRSTIGDGTGNISEIFKGPMSIGAIESSLLQQEAFNQLFQSSPSSNGPVPNQNGFSSGEVSSSLKTLFRGPSNLLSRYL